MSYRVGRTLGTTIYHESDMQPTAWVPDHPELAARIAGLLNVEGAIRELAKLAIAWKDAHQVYFPSSAQEAEQLARSILLETGVRYWISPLHDAITCVACGLTSHNRNDVEHRYCGKCKEFLANPADSATNSADCGKGSE